MKNKIFLIVAEIVTLVFGSALFMAAIIPGRHGDDAGLGVGLVVLGLRLRPWINDFSKKTAAHIKKEQTSINKKLYVS